ncbi:MAG TPA: hypothetical protein VKV25_02590 [Acidimicrobiales bacterium]|nr:hypothetical protein [Acidimicrobiales bacterium]
MSAEEELRAELEAIAERLADLALDRLREALLEASDVDVTAGDDTAGDDTAGDDTAGDDTAGPTRRPGAGRRRGSPAAEAERRLTRARRAVERAAAILAGGATGRDGSEADGP